MKTSDLAPGWKMTLAQRAAYWRYWSAVQAKLGLTGRSAAELSEHRADLHERAGLGRCSAKEIDKLKGFDAIKAVFLAILDPDNVEAQLAQLNMPRTRLLTKIRSMCHEDYWLALLRSDRFRPFCPTGRLEDLSDRDLEQFRMTLAARLNAAKTGEPEKTPLERMLGIEAPQETVEEPF